MRLHPGLDLAFGLRFGKAVTRPQALDQSRPAAADAGDVFVM
jgi:hypothetical protein